MIVIMEAWVKENDECVKKIVAEVKNHGLIPEMKHNCNPVAELRGI